MREWGSGWRGSSSGLCREKCPSLIFSVCTNERVRVRGQGGQQKTKKERLLGNSRAEKQRTSEAPETAGSGDTEDRKKAAMQRSQEHQKHPRQQKTTNGAAAAAAAPIAATTAPATKRARDGRNSHLAFRLGKARHPLLLVVLQAVDHRQQKRLPVNVDAITVNSHKSWCHVSRLSFLDPGFPASSTAALQKHRRDE